MRILNATFFGLFLTLAACQPKDVKLPDPKSKNNQSSGFNTMGNSTATPEDIFQYALTRLHQVVVLSRLTPDSACIDHNILYEDSKNKTTALSYHNCSLDQSPQAENLSVLIDRGVHEVIMTKKEEKQGFDFQNLQSFVLTTRVPVDIRINPTGKTNRRGSASISEQTYFQLTQDLEAENTFQFIFSVQGRFYETVVASQWDSRTNGTQEIYFRGRVTYDPAKRGLGKMYIQEISVKDVRPKVVNIKASGFRDTFKPAEKKEFTQTLNIYLTYGEPGSIENPALAFDINEKDCWTLAGQGQIKRTSNGFVNATAADKKSDFFSLNKEKLVLGGRAINWPSCSKMLTPMDIAYGAIFIK